MGSVFDDDGNERFAFFFLIVNLDWYLTPMAYSG